MSHSCVMNCAPLPPAKCCWFRVTLYCLGAIGVLSTRCFPSELCLLGALVLFPDCLWLLTFCSAALGGKKRKLKSVSTTVGIWGSVLVSSEILFKWHDSANLFIN